MAAMPEIRVLESGEVAGLASYADYVDAVREGYRQVGEGSPAKPRTSLTSADPPGFLTAYMAILPETGVMGTYTYTAGFGAEDAHFLLPLFDADSGEPLALFDGASMNPYKTGAAGAVGVDALAREDAAELAVIGSGSQARAQVAATATVRDLDRVRVYSPTPDSRASFAAEFDDRLRTAAVSAVDSPAAAVSGADIVVTATRATEPVFDGDDLAEGAHVTAMGQYSPDAREVDGTTVSRAKYVPDLRARADLETGDAGAYIQAVREGAVDADHLHAELGEVVAGTEPGRTSSTEVTLFDSGGTGIETVAAAGMLYERAREQDLGEAITVTPASEAF